MADRVVLAPPVPTGEVVRWAAGADVGLALIQNVSLSYFLSLPNKLFEYVAAGLPVVASDFPDLRRVVEERGLGTVCRPDDPAAIARAIAWVARRPRAARAVAGGGERGRRRADMGARVARPGRAGRPARRP